MFPRSLRPMIRYPVTAQAPKRARIFPNIGRPCKTSEKLGQDKLPFQTHALANPIIVPPIKVKNKPINAGRASFSFRKIGDSRVTQSGPVLTNTTELATVVYSSEEIHVAK